MNSIATSFVITSAVALLLVPRRWAPLPLIAGTCYMTLGQGIEIGPLTFTVIRILIAVGLIRVITRREWLAGGIGRLDYSILLWAMWACVSSVFHQPFESSLVFRLGLVYNACGVYFLVRIFCTSLDDIARLSRMVALLLIPVALAMAYEQLAIHNPFSLFGGVSDIPELREGRLRASGPFAHPILAGTVGAVTLPLMMGIWRYQRLTAFAGAGACLTMVVTSASSSPALGLVAGMIAFLMRRFQSNMRLIRRIAVCAYIGLNVVMKAPAYYLIARIDIVGGSTGWHRARLIESSIEHLNEWWVAGTDYTRHWMPTGLAVSPNHSDITNQYLSMGVLGGLPLVALLIVILSVAFSRLGAATRRSRLSSREQLVAWTLGSSLLAHSVTFVAVSYFDQSIVFFYLTLAAIGSMPLSDVPAEVAMVGNAVSQRTRRPARFTPVAPAYRGGRGAVVQGLTMPRRPFSRPAAKG